MVRWHRHLNGCESEPALGHMAEDRGAWRAAARGIAKRRT